MPALIRHSPHLSILTMTLLAASALALAVPADGAPGAARQLANAPSAAAAVPALGAHTLSWQENGYGVSPAVTEPVDTARSGSSLLAFQGGFASNTRTPVDNKGNTWTMLGAPVVYRGYEGWYDVKAYVVRDGHGGAGHVVSIDKNGTAIGELTLPFIEVRNATVIADVAQNYPEAAARITSGSVTTTGPAVLVALWWGDANALQHSAIPDNGFSVIDSFLDLPPSSGVQCAVAYREVATAGTWQVTWTQAPAQGAVLWLIAFQAAPAVADTIFSAGFDEGARGTAAAGPVGASTPGA